MDKVSLCNMKFFGYHGCEDFEKLNGQTFEVDADIFADLRVAGQTDCLNDAINYVDIYGKIKQVMETERFDLLERVVQRLADRVLEDTRVVEVVLRIRKPKVPLPGMLNGVQIEIRRGRRV
jgi:7,8-dihydroneopterin aldolase/epimerase/oxygenase